MNQPNTTETYYSKFSKPNHLSDSEIIEEIKEFWKEAKSLPMAIADTFYCELDDILNENGFTQEVREINSFCLSCIASNPDFASSSPASKDEMNNRK